MKKRTGVPRFHKKFSDREILDVALDYLEKVLTDENENRNGNGKENGNEKGKKNGTAGYAADLTRLGRRMVRRLSSRTPEEVMRVVRRLYTRDPYQKFSSPGEASVELYRVRGLLADVGREPPAFGAAVIASLLRALAVLTAVSAVFGAGLAVYFLFPDGVFLRSVEVPDLVGTNLRETVPDERLFTLAAAYRFDSGTEPGTVLSQQPSPGMIRKVEPGKHPCTLTVSVSLGPELVEVGDYRGLTEHSARVACRRLGLVVRTQTVPGHAYGNVAYTQPAAGEVLAKGAILTLFVGADRRPARVALPNLVGVNEATACSMLSSLGLIRGKVTYMISDQPAGVVIAQSVLSGTELDAGAKVGFVVSRGSD